MAWRKQYVGVFELEYNGCKFYFIDNEFYFNGDKPYDFIHLDCEKFIFFSKAVLSILQDRYLYSLIRSRIIRSIRVSRLL